MEERELFFHGRKREFNDVLSSLNDEFCFLNGERFHERFEKIIFISHGGVVDGADDISSDDLPFELAVGKDLLDDNSLDTFSYFFG